MTPDLVTPSGPCAMCGTRSSVESSDWKRRRLLHQQVQTIDVCPHTRPEGRQGPQAEQGPDGRQACWRSSETEAELKGGMGPPPELEAWRADSEQPTRMADTVSWSRDVLT